MRAPGSWVSLLGWFLALLVGLALASSPAVAHKKHKHQENQQSEVVQDEAPSARGAAATGPSSPTAEHGSMSEMMGEPEADRSSMTFGARLLDWFGRLHPVIVHFPIAFFPAALVTAIVGRRRPAFGAPVRFLVIAGGIIAPVAAVLGWLDAIAADPSPLLTVHRWLGTAVGIGGMGLALWAWRRPDQDRSAGMLAALTLITAAIVVQGWFGGALVHGIDHMNW
jgi:uncharacterized membrane protein